MEGEKRTIAKLKRRLSNSITELTSIYATGKSALKEKDKYLNTFKSMHSSLEKYYSMYEDCYDELAVISEIKSDDGDTESPAFIFPSQEDQTTTTTMRKYYYEIKTMYNSLTSMPPPPPSSSTSQSFENTTIIHEPSSRLPEIKLSPFDGEILNWPKFRDTYVSIVHEDKTLSQTQKFHYLLTSLKGPALSIINQFQISDQTYPLAWQAINDAYDKKRLLATAYLNRILNFHPIQGKPSVESLKSFMTAVCDSVSSFELLRISHESKFILFHLAYRVLDQTTRDQFQNAHKDTEFPTFEQLFKFIKDRCFSMQVSSDVNFDSAPSTKSKANTNNNRNKIKDKKLSKSSLVAQESKPPNPNEYFKHPSLPPVPCSICNEGSHGLLSCRKFCSANVKQRNAFLTNWKGCKNCLSIKHKIDFCKSKWVCRFCKQKHNSMLCDINSPNSAQNRNNDEQPSTSNNIGSLCTTPGAYASTDKGSHVMLGTALAEVLDARGIYQVIRIVVDTASHYSFMTYKCAKRLGLTSHKCYTAISGIGQSAGGTKHSVTCNIKPINKSAPLLNLTALLLKSITSHLPTATLPRRLWEKFLKFPLADPTFFESRPIDVLLGADMFADIWLGSPIELDSNSPKLFPTVFGHVVIGSFSSESSQSSHGTSLVVTGPTTEDLNLILRRFWEIEEPKPVHVINPEDSYCEDHFLSTHYRLEDGSYGVRLPFRSMPPEFPDISTIARRRFRNQENKLFKNDELREQYHEFMQEYEQLGHMSISTDNPAYVIPHHHVTKIDRNQVKIRVVFDGSAKSSNGSLNDQLLVGPKLQTDIRDVLLNFRVHKVALVADIVKMYRNIWIHPDDRKYQSIFWRFTPFDTLHTYSLNTVVYGLTSSPFQALRVIRQLVIDEGTLWPEASTVLTRDIYIDDIVTGCNSIDKAIILQKQLIDLLGRAQLKLSKWASNYPELLQHIPNSTTNDKPVTIISKDDTSVKILGLHWNPKTDCFSYHLEVPTLVFTKRAICSNVAKIYDPLGFISPVVIMMKKFIQDLWKLEKDWDDPIPEDIAVRWESAIKQLPIISKVDIPRFICSDKPSVYQLVGFADASETAYCAALYLRVEQGCQVKVNLMTAKTKLAPLNTLTIPRLELCGCLLLAKLYQSVHSFLELLGTQPITSPCFFTDSSIALGWLRTPIYKLKTFVCNRVSEVLQLTSDTNWHHVSSNDNPADAGSRGFLPDEILHNKLWWHGPPWLEDPQNTWNISTAPIIPDLPEIKPGSTLISVKVNPLISSSFITEIIFRFSSFHRMLRVIARILRFVHNLKNNNSEEKLSGPLQIDEINSARTLCIKSVQSYYFFKDDFSTKQQAVVMQKFVKLNPFFDSSGILRAGGRLFNANLPFNHKHPVLLPSESHLSTLIVDHFHRVYLHPGPSLLQALIQLEYWIPSARRLVRQRIFGCQRCYRLKAKTFIPKMADLPSYRIQAERAFKKVGLDFAGPFLMKESIRRKAAVSKVYMCIFVCMTTKAIHLEAVTNLTADAFLAALERFVSLRGLPSDIYSDCGSNFVSASGKLKEWFKWYLKKETQDELSERVALFQVNWHFNPPRAPHFGGIWEAGVKSVKSLMLRSVGDAVLTYEEFATLFAKIGAILNSRPICPLSSDPSENEYLSPGHFLIGHTPVAIPEPNLMDVNINRLDRWQLIKRMSQFFWDRWHREYLSTLQSRVKWTDSAPSLRVGDLVFLKEDNLPVLQWTRGRIVEVHPGRDGAVRVATVRTPTSTFCRPVAKLVPLFPERASNSAPADNAWNGWPQKRNYHQQHSA